MVILKNIHPTSTNRDRIIFGPFLIRIVYFTSLASKVQNL